jgi:hypothetical protein
MTMLDPRTRDDLVNEATAEHRTIPRSRTVLVELAARVSARRNCCSRQRR